MKRSKAEVIREYGPFPEAEQVHGVSFDGKHVWFASGNRLNTFDPESGEILRSLDVAGHAGTAFDGDPGLAWAEGTLWVGQYRERKIHQIDPETGAILRTIESNRFVTGVTWVDGELWHGTWEGPDADIRRVDPQTGEV